MTHSASSDEYGTWPIADLDEFPPPPETFYAIRRTDGEDIGEGYRWCDAIGPDDWAYADEMERCLDEPTEYEIVLMTVTSVAKRTFGPDEGCERP